MPERRKIFETEDSDFGGGAYVPWTCVFPLGLPLGIWSRCGQTDETDTGTFRLTEKAASIEHAGRAV